MQPRVDRHQFTLEPISKMGTAFGRRCIPSGGVAPPSHTPGMLGRRALPDGRLAALGAAPPFLRWVLVLLAWLGGALGGATDCLAQDVARMDRVVQSYVSHGTFAGSVLVARGSHVIVSKGYGLANVEWNVPNSPSARFKVASKWPSEL